MNDNYTKGFNDKCAEYNIDSNDLIKLAQRYPGYPYSPFSDPMTMAMMGGMAGSMAGSAANNNNADETSSYARDPVARTAYNKQYLNRSTLGRIGQNIIHPGKSRLARKDIGLQNQQAMQNLNKG